MSLSLRSDVDQSVRAWAQHSSDKKRLRPGNGLGAAAARCGAPLDEEAGNGMAALSCLSAFGPLGGGRGDGTQRLGLCNGGG
eukprot:scaffold33165_cov68-Phaeocystis_antarctica.AAC.5